MFTLDNHLGLYIPSTDYDVKLSEDICQGRIETISRLFSSFFGATTLSSAFGYYLANNSQLISEDITIAISHCTSEAYKQYKQTVFDLASYYCIQWKQESIAILDNGQLSLVTSDDLTRDITSLRQLISYRLESARIS